MKTVTTFILAFLLLMFGGGEKREKTSAVWITQFDMCRAFLCADEDSVREKAREMCDTLVSAECNTVFLQMHPNGDSMYTSDLFPASKYLCGEYGKALKCDAAGILIGALAEKGIKVYAWINPYRLMTEKEMQSIGNEYEIRRAYDSRDGSIRLCDGRLYFDPSSEKARRMICECADEILCLYDVEGIVIDDYFYPTHSEDFDRDSFASSGETDLAQFRRDSITKLIASLHETTSAHGAKLCVAPAGNIYSLYDGYYLDIPAWCESGYVDLLSPQIYFGYKNKYCPFYKVLRDWESAAGDVPVVPSLAAYKAASAEPDGFAGGAEAMAEWSEDDGVLYRQIRYCRMRYGGCVLFSYESLSGLKVDKIKASW